jgi:DNA-binding MarR family transcriptional regulator
MAQRKTKAAQTPTGLGACACFRARTAARAITDFYDRTLEPSGLRLTQMALLAAIAASEHATMQSIASELGLDPSTMTRTLRPLEQGKLVRSRAGSDRRAKEIELTAVGRERLRAGHRCWQDAQRTLSDKLGRATFERLIADLASVTRILSPKETSKEVTK